MENERPYIARYSLHKRLRCTALIPDFQLSTHLARGVLPKEVPYGDAIFNVSRTAVLLRALEEGDTETISVSLRDKLHQPFRRTLIPGFDEAEPWLIAAAAWRSLSPVRDPPSCACPQTRIFLTQGLPPVFPSFPAIGASSPCL